jgi:hypothetical protein
MDEHFHLLRPEILWALLGCPLVALALWYQTLQQGDWSRVIDPELSPLLATRSAPDSGRCEFGCRHCCWPSSSPQRDPAFNAWTCL